MTQTEGGGGRAGGGEQARLHSGGAPLSPVVGGRWPRAHLWGAVWVHCCRSLASEAFLEAFHPSQWLLSIS